MLRSLFVKFLFVHECGESGVVLRLVRFAALYGRCIVFFYIVKFLFVHECGDVRHEKMHDIQISPEYYECLHYAHFNQ